MRDQLRRRLVQHARTLGIERQRRLRRNLGRGLRRRARRRRRHTGQAVEAQAPDPAVRDDLVELILIDLPPQVRPRPRPVTFLDDAVVHVGDVDRAVGRGLDVDRPEQRIGAQDELRSGIDVAQLRQPFVLDDAGAANEAADRLADQQIALQVRRHPVRADDVGAGGGGEMIQAADRHADANHAALRVREPGLGQTISKPGSSCSGTVNAP